jgi:hypothetical protein
MERMRRFSSSGRRLRSSATVAFLGMVACVTWLPAVASADRVYHSEHLALTPVGSAPLRSGFVENIKAEGPTVYAHEIFVLNGASPYTTYTVTRNFFFLQPDCSGDGLVFNDEVAVLQTNAAGNARGDLLVRPADVAGAEGVSGVFWSVADETGEVVYRTACTAVTLD